MQELRVRDGLHEAQRIYFTAHPQKAMIEEKMRIVKLIISEGDILIIGAVNDELKYYVDCRQGVNTFR